MKNLARGILVIVALAGFAPHAHADFAAAAAFQDGDYKAAYREGRPLAEKGNAAAQHNLGILYNNGLGLDANMVEAAKWYRRAAQGGNANAQTKMGVFLARGLGLAQDYTQAVGWFREAAEQHHAQAQFNLGILYATGSGVEQDRVQALMWLSLGHAAGVEQAAQPRDLLIREMAPEDVEEAALLTEFMKPPGRSGRNADAPIAPLQNEAPSKEPDEPVMSVQLASYDSKQAAAEGWAKLRQVHGDLSLCRALSTAAIPKMDVMLRNSMTFDFLPDPITAQFIGRIDGRKSIGDIVEELLMVAGISTDFSHAGALLEHISDDLDVMNAFNWIVLRDPTTAEVAPMTWKEKVGSPYVYEEPALVPKNRMHGSAESPPIDLMNFNFFD